MPKSKTVKNKGVRKVVMMGGYGHKAAAESACADFLRPSVFMYQTAIFPNPVAFNVDVVITKAEALELDKPQTPLYPWGVKLTIAVKGDRAAAWMKAFEDRTRGIRL